MLGYWGEGMFKCPFCNIDKTKIENTILDETDSFFITPSLGSIVEGYILIISKKHINSMSQLNKYEMKEYEELINKYRKVFKSVYNKYPIIFEHGTLNTKKGNKASSVVHSHTHIVNHQYKNEKDLLQELNFKKIDSFNDMDFNNNYIFYINPNNEIYITYNFKSISQLMRIEIARDLNLLEKYDWRKNNFNNNVVLTIRNIENYFNNETKKKVKI